MAKKCDHHYWAPMISMRLCYKCGHSINVYPMQSYSQKEFRKMYPSQFTFIGNLGGIGTKK